jgi:bifunctional non-homologous end joining protein LigD
MTAAPLVFAHACKMGLEGIVSKRRDSRYRSGRSSDRIKSEQDMSRQDALNFIIHGIVKSVLQADVTYWP